MLGSANITKNGLNINKLGNTEMATLFNMDKSDVTLKFLLKKVLSLFSLLFCKMLLGIYVFS